MGVDVQYPRAQATQEPPQAREPGIPAATELQPVREPLINQPVGDVAATVQETCPVGTIVTGGEVADDRTDLALDPTGPPRPGEVEHVAPLDRRFPPRAHPLPGKAGAVGEVPDEQQRPQLDPVAEGPPGEGSTHQGPIVGEFDPDPPTGLRLLAMEAECSPAVGEALPAEAPQREVG
jgi:hypothetical protein